MATEVKIEDISSVEKKLSFEVLWDEVKSELDSIYKKVGKGAKVKGFRQGKAPRNVLELHYGDKVEEDVISNLVTKNYTEAVEKNGIAVAAQPVVDQKGIKKGESFIFSVTVETQPEIDPKGYEGLELEKEELDVTPSDVDERIEQIRQMYATLEDVSEDRALAEGDFALIDFVGKLNGEVRPGMESSDYTLQIGSKSFIPGFEEQIVGMKKGDSKDISLTFPEEYGAKDLAGKEVVFSVALKNIRAKVLPALDEEFIKNFEKYENLNDLTEDVRKSLEEEGEARIKAELRSAIADKLLERNDLEVPSSWVERQIYNMMMDARQRMVQNGMPDNKAAELTYSLHDKFKEQATTMVKASFLLNEIAKKESIEVSDEEVDAKIRELADRYKQDYETVNNAYESNGVKENFKVELLENKTMDFIEGKATITPVKKDKAKAERGEE